MRIAIDCRLWAHPQAPTLFFGAAVVPLFIEQPGNHQYFLVFDAEPAEVWKNHPGVTILVLKPMAGSAATRVLWYDLRLPALLSSHQIDLFIGAAGYISLRSAVKQVLILNDVLSGQLPPSFAGWSGSWYHRRLPAMLAKASGHVIPAKGALESFYRGTPSAKEPLVLPAYPLWPLGFSPEEVPKKQVKQTISNGSEYFLCMDGWQSLEDALALLLAFSTFKKRQLTGMKLVLSGNPPTEKEWKEKLQTFRYKQDVILLENSPEPHPFFAIFCTAYGLLHLSGSPKLQMLQQALSAGVPVISMPLPANYEMAGDALLYCTDAPGEGLAQNMMRLYKDENLRAELIKKGKAKAGDWDAQKTVAKLLEMCLASH
jgi:glycosyltransferase involved in cell wall biosynthesis